MQKKATAQELQLIEARLALREADRVKRDRLLASVFWFGLPCGVLAGVVRAVLLVSPLPLVLGVTWGVCAITYTAGKTLPVLFSNDRDLRWHLNPWREAIPMLVSEGREWKGITLLFAFPVGRILGGFVMFAFG